MSVNASSGIIVSQIARALAQAGEEVVFTGIGKEGAFFNPHFFYLRIPEFRFRIANALAALIYNTYAVLFTKADVIFVSKPLLHSCLPVFLKKYSRVIRLLHMDDIEHGLWKGTILEGIMRLSEIFLVRYFDFIIVPTVGIKKYVLEELKIPGEKVLFLRQGVNFSFFENVSNALLQEKFKLGSKKVIVYAARLGQGSKGLNIIFRVFKKILEKRKQVILLIIGGGPGFEYHKKVVRELEIQDNVIFVGSVPYEEVPKYLSLGDIAVNYLEDNFANRCKSNTKIRDYLAAGLPVVCNYISNDLDAFREFVYTFPTGDLDEFERKLLEAIERKDRSISLRAREYMKENWDWKEIANEFLTEFLERKKNLGS